MDRKLIGAAAFAGLAALGLAYQVATEITSGQVQQDVKPASERLAGTYTYSLSGNSPHK